MSMILQNLLGNAGATTATKASGTNVASAPGFNQALVQVMGTNGTPANPLAQTASGIMGTAASLLETLQAMISGGQQSTDVTGEGTDGEQVEKVGKLLDDLLDKLQDMDQAITTDPALVQSLQGWLTQVQQVLSGSSEQTSSTEGTEAQNVTGANILNTGQEAMNNLAKNPETLRFAVADAVTQIVDTLQAVKNGTQAANPELEQLLTGLQTMLQKASIQTPDAVTTSVNNQGAIITAPKDEAKANTAAQITVVDETKKAAEQGAVQSIVQNAAKDASGDQAATSDQSDEQPEPVVMTVGQFAMRAEAAPTAKVVVPTTTVNIQNFPDEMSKFIVNKLDVQQVKGMSEATISLNPENLGQVDVKITIQNGQVLAQFITEKHMAKDMLDQQMSQLRSALQSQGLQVEKLEVTQSSSLQSQMYNGGQGFGSSAGQQQSGRRSNGREEQNDDAILAVELNGELKEWREETKAATASSTMNYGSTYVAKA